MKVYSIIIFLVLLSFDLSSQMRHELKLDFGIVRGSKYKLDYENMFGNRLGVEAGLGYTPRIHSLVSFDNQGVNFHNFKTKYLNYYLGFKYYFFEPGLYKSLFVGLFFKSEYLIKREESFYLEYEEITGKKPGPRVLMEGLFENFGYGVQIGYKVLIKNSVILEFQVTEVYLKPVGFGSDDLAGVIDAVAFIKLGYRFKNNKK